MVTAGAVFHVVDSVPGHLKGRMIGYFGLPGFVMLASGPSLAEVFQKFGGIRGTFLAILGFYSSMIWILRRLPESLQRQDLPSEPFSKIFQQNFFKRKSILVLSFNFGFCYSIWQSFLAPVLSPLGAGAVSSFGLGYGVGAVLTRLGISQFLETEKRRLAAVSGLIRGLPGCTSRALSSLATRRVGPLHRDEPRCPLSGVHSVGTRSGMSLYISSSSLGLFVGPPLWGFLADRTGYGWVFAAAGATVVAATVVFIAFEWRAPMILKERGRSKTTRRRARSSRA